MDFELFGSYANHSKTMRHAQEPGPRHQGQGQM